ncbi:MAG: cytochrome bc complex cytochrome b subunit [Nitrososphaerota archaeon]|nr:cytochrome bc complex cytochrome b subunit [Nitrososphaerota archaeon]
MTSEQAREKRDENREERVARPAGGVIGRVAEWFDSRIGLSYRFLRDAPAYSINPFYWLGALTVVAFVIQGVTGIMMMLYYIPTPTQAYSSTQFIFQHVSYGRFLETVHLYTAYAMIALAFMHMMRGYFVSVYKKPREVMWLVGMGMGFVTLLFGFTGYLLPWTVVSKSATDVGVGMMSALPQPVSSFLTFLIVGSNGDAGTLLRFYDLHVVLLPAVLLLLLGVKMFMLEAHGISEPVRGLESTTEKERKLIPIFPDVSFYLVELAGLFGAAMLLISAIFPLSLPPQYTPQLAAQYTPQPDWYFLWIYQILKVEIFEGNGLPVALSAITIIFIVLTLLPIIDRRKEKSIGKRKIFVTLGAMFVSEVVTLSVWGELTPGQIIPNEQATLILGGVALIVALCSAAVYRLVYRSTVGRKQLVSTTAATRQASSASENSLPPSVSPSLRIGVSFVAVLGLSALSIGSTVNSLASIIVEGLNASLIGSLALSVFGVAISASAIIYILYRLELGSGSLKRRYKALEVGWRKD